VITIFFVTSLHSRPYILFANRKDIRLMEITDNKRKAPTNVIVKNLEIAAAIDYFLKLNKVCWSEINREVIRCAEITPSSRGKVTKTNIVSTGLMKPEGLACDWINNKIYWTDCDTKRIEVAGLSGLDQDRTVLVWEDLGFPRAISVDPLSGYMFWTDWGSYPKVERCGMDGSSNTRKTLVDNDLIWPNGLTLDFVNQRVYWVEARLFYIASVDYDGRRWKSIYMGDENSLPQPFSVSFFHDVVYWTDWKTDSLNLYNSTLGVLNRVKVRGKISPMDVKIFEPDRQQPGDSPCHHSNGGCSHICLAAPLEPRYSCHCPTGFKKLNKTTCADRNSEILLLAARDSIIKVSLDTPDHTGIVIPLKTVVNSIAIDYDATWNKVFWTDLAVDKRQAIRSANLDGFNETDVVVDDVDHPDGIAVDWVAKNLFWTDSGTDRIELARLDGSSRRVLISEDLDEPRSIVLDPINGWIFWSDWGKRPRIERAWMDGRGREVVINSDLEWPNGIALDISREKLYWCDAKIDRIEVSNTDGSDRAVLINRDVDHPFGLTLLGSNIYWTDWKNRNIQRANKFDGSNRTILVSDLNDLMGLKSVSTNPQLDFPYPCDTESCSHLCLMTPNGAVCACPNGYELTANRKSCMIPEAVLLYTRRDDIVRISMETPNTNITIPLKGVEEANALDFDRMNGMIYWSDTKSRTISRAFLNGSNQEIVVEFGLDYPASLAVDWVTGNLFWLDAGINRIEMSRLDGTGTGRRVLLWQNVENLKSITVDPLRGLIIWSSWGQVPLIEKSGSDGEGRSNLVENEGKATGLTIDVQKQRLFWSDQDSSEIKWLSLLSSNGKVEVLFTGKQPNMLAKFQSNLYWTDRQEQTVSRMDLDAPASVDVIHSGVDYVMDIVAFHFTTPAVVSPCSQTNCSGLCISKLVEGALVSRCVCPSHYTLSDDGVSCQAPKSFLLFSQRNKISRLLIDPNHNSEVPDIVLPIKRAKAIQSIEYNSLDRMIYWIDHGKREQPYRTVIQRSPDTGETSRLGTFVKSASFAPYDIVIDSYTQLLYCTCEHTNYVNVTRLSGKTPTYLGPLFVGGGSSLPRLLALHSKKQQLFVSMSGDSAGEARIDLIALMTGKHTTLVNTSVSEISAIAIDTSSNVLYWTDRGYKKLEMIDVVSKKRTGLITEGIVDPVGLAIQENWVYWADQDQNSIVRVNKRTGTSRQTILSQVQRLSALIAVNQVSEESLRQHPCYQLDASVCSHFCIEGSDGLAQCSCPVGMALQDDRRTCGTPGCKIFEFTCTSKGNAGEGPLCIPLTWRCDGQPECGDQSDEANCPDYPSSNRFQCGSQRGECGTDTKVCNDVDCGGGSGESQRCTDSQVLCSVSNKCIDLALICSGQVDCNDELPAECKSPLPMVEIAPTSMPTSHYLIAIFAALISMFLISFLVYYYKRRAGTNAVSEDQDATRPLASRPSMDLGHVGGSLKAERGQTLGGDQAGNSALSVNMSPVDGSSNGLLYDRSHVTGASSTAGTSSSGNFPGPGPPPSPATSVGIRLPRCGGHLRQFGSGKQSTSAFNVGLPTGYRFYNTHKGGAPPPCTPCSTDINDESDSVAYSALPHRPHFTSRAVSVAPSRNGYDSESYAVEEMQNFMGELPSLTERGRYAPPPSTPLYLSDYGEPELSCAPSPTTERSFFLNPCLPGPPPSPVPSPTHNQSLDEHS